MTHCATGAVSLVNVVFSAPGWSPLSWPPSPLLILPSLILLQIFNNNYS